MYVFSGNGSLIHTELGQFGLPPIEIDIKDKMKLYRNSTGILQYALIELERKGHDFFLTLLMENLALDKLKDLRNQSEHGVMSTILTRDDYEKNVINLQKYDVADISNIKLQVNEIPRIADNDYHKYYFPIHDH